MALRVRFRSLRTAFSGSIRVGARVCEVCTDCRHHSALCVWPGGARAVSYRPYCPVAWTPEEGTRFKQERWGQQGGSRWETLRSHGEGDLGVRQARGTAWDMGPQRHTRAAGEKCCHEARRENLREPQSAAGASGVTSRPSLPCRGFPGRRTWSATARTSW